MILDRDAFILAHTRLAPVPLVPEIVLYQADDVAAIWQKTEDDLGSLNLPPPFWAFAWAGGQALARYVLDHPDIVHGRRVLDFATGSGLVAIAAAQAGAAEVVANDIDAFALAAIGLNGAQNRVSIQALGGDIIGSALAFDVVLAGDIAYERETAHRVTLWLEGLASTGMQVLIGDPGRAFLARDKLVEIGTYDVPVSREIEDGPIKRGSVYRFAGT